MPRKIGFVVVNSSSHEDNFTAKELMVHAPAANGWRSSRLCSYPQHVTLQLVERSRVRKLQLLAHQYLIPAKVEFHIGDTLPEASTAGFPGQLRRLGYVSLSDNEKTGFKARELKSVHVDAVGTYLRITFHTNHVNGYNHHNQVLLICPSVYPQPSREQLIEHYLNSTQLEAALDTTFMGSCESFSPFDDLAFEMYQDPEVAHIIRLMDQQKQDMVRQEKYEQAKNLKQAIADLQKVGERLARYDVEKRCAIEKEDYDLAKKKKELMEEYRRSVYQQLEKYGHMWEESVGLHFDAIHLNTDLIMMFSVFSTVSPDHGVNTFIPTPGSSPRSFTSMPYDERPLPALQKRDQPMEATRSPAEQQPAEAHRSPPGPEMSGEPEPLTERAQREAGLAVDVYGESLVAGAYSKSWSHREDALLAVHKRLLEASPTAPKEELRNMLRAAVFLVKKALQDKVSSVFQASLTLLRLMLSQLIPDLGLGRPEAIHCFEQTWPNLLARTGDSAGRPRATVTAFIQEIAVLKDVRALQVVPAELVQPLKSNFPSRLAQSRTELLEKLLTELGTENSGFTLDNVMTFCTAALEHSASTVREPAVRIILSMYRQHRAAALSYLPPNDAAARKNFLYKTLFDGFAKIDGKLTLNTGGGQQEGQKEKEEIHSLQEQLAALKEITVGGVVIRLIHTLCFSLCVFCGKKDESFTEDGLDLHYWKHCPMLRCCDECRQVVEIASLTEHLLGECESHSKFGQCPRCSEAVATEDLTRHVQGPSCNRESCLTPIDEYLSSFFSFLHCLLKGTHFHKSSCTVAPSGAKGSSPVFFIIVTQHIGYIRITTFWF
uniref:Centrosomal protein of 104 kDa n=1 Tax=Scophthalmus maximus TaxID=52904 RepID=A0A8D3AAV4_SCOMX